MSRVVKKRPKETNPDLARNGADLHSRETPLMRIGTSCRLTVTSARRRSGVRQASGLRILPYPQPIYQAKWLKSLTVGALFEAAGCTPVVAPAVLVHFPIPASFLLCALRPTHQKGEAVSRSASSAVSSAHRRESQSSGIGDRLSHYGGGILRQQFCSVRTIAA